MKFTRLHINSLIAITMLFVLAIFLAYDKDHCAAVGLAGTISVVALHFAKQPGNGDDNDK